MLHSSGDLCAAQPEKIGRQRVDNGDMQMDNLVPAVGQVDPEDTHAMEDKLHGGQEVIQHCRLPRGQSAEAKFMTC